MAREGSRIKGMSDLNYLLYTFGGALVGGLLTSLYYSRQLSSQKEVTLKLEGKRDELLARLQLLTEGKEEMRKAFQSMSYEALEKNANSFLQLAKETFGKTHEMGKGELEKRQKAFETLVAPVKESLAKMDEKMATLDKERKSQHAALLKQIEVMSLAEKDLKKETASLVKALSNPVARGRWGEVQLKRCVELSGMLNHCDFFEQNTAYGEEGRLRPDLIIKLPGNKQIILDAKTPLDAYLLAQDAECPNERHKKLVEHAQRLKAHIQELGKKAYWEHFTPTPEFVILFLPSEAFFSAALEVDPTLIERGAESNVILATPTTLIGLLKAVAFGWKQELMSEHAEHISRVGKELYKRIADMKHHWDRLGKSLSTAVESYNKSVGSLETRVLVSARKLNELGAGSQKVEIDPVDFIEKIPRQIQAEEMALDEEVNITD